MRLCVSGGRHFANVALLWRTLDAIHAEEGGVSLLVEGASDELTGPYIGADYWANQWAMARMIPALRVPADWKKYGRAAGPIRNGTLIARFGLHRVVAFPGGAGTANMIAQAEKAGIAVQRIKVEEKA